MMGGRLGEMMAATPRFGERIVVQSALPQSIGAYAFVSGAAPYLFSL